MAGASTHIQVLLHNCVTLVETRENLVCAQDCIDRSSQIVGDRSKVNRLDFVDVLLFFVFPQLGDIVDYDQGILIL